ncbi:hypothetical protein [Allochromatium tepidum]|uniref:hypothetical protein n=1 Tax=Allochromatium tepidum TaxID=553982 RepID=UPI001BCC36AB|nr:hypothetical protein [Allochromatium tepidum]
MENKFDHFELDPNNNRILACDGESRKTPISVFSGIDVVGNRVIVYDDGRKNFVFEVPTREEALKKVEELTAFANTYRKISPSWFKP